MPILANAYLYIQFSTPSSAVTKYFHAIPCVNVHLIGMLIDVEMNDIAIYYGPSEVEMS